VGRQISPRPAAGSDQLLALLRLLLLSDSALPTGGFTSSMGWEAAVRDGSICCARDLADWLEGTLDDLLVPVELPHLARAHRCRGPRAVAAVSHRLDRFVALPGWRAASQASGARLLQLSARRPHGWHRAVVFGWLAGLAGAPLEWAAAAHSQAALWSQAQVATRLGVVSSDDAVAAVARLGPRVATAAGGCAGGRVQPAMSVRWEIAGMRQPLLNSRLFAS
jgi:urease accessory protein